MSRVKRGVTSHAKHKKVLEQAKGFYGRRKNTDISVSKAEVLGERGGGFSIPSFDPHAKKAMDIGGQAVVDPHAAK